MEVLSIILSALAGGLLASAAFAGQVRRARASATEALNRIRNETGAKLKTLQSAQDTAKERADELEKSVLEYKSRAEEASSGLKESEAARSRAVEQANAYQAQWQQAEGKARQAQAQGTDAVKETKGMQDEIGALKKANQDLRDAADRRGGEIERLRAEVAAARTGSASGLDKSVEAFAENSSLEEILGTLVTLENQRSAVLADRNGIIVAAAGDAALKEGMAAATQTLSTLGNQLEAMVPFGGITSFKVVDRESVIAGRTFSCAGENISLATFGVTEPSDRLLDGAMANLNAALE